ncbi:H/ACA ribonucleoprotein complex subunit 3 [Trichinella pseudospiralis]|uniref:Nucleolar protein 10 n=2 Tax=Trichinella pseudospiralis TaxID=6337 RepID=A0A0V0XT81_TRIPS|nr:H/ACA ribonucleoprotein complex subunit 3 [Trichinella pseudospiralis]
MYLYYYLNENGDRVYTLKAKDPAGRLTLSAHPAKFSPQNTFSQQRILIKRRYHLLPMQQKLNKFWQVRKRVRQFFRKFQPEDYRTKLKLMHHVRLWYFALAWGGLGMLLLGMRKTRNSAKVSEQ